MSREAADRELARAAAELVADLERSAPNMKALEQYAAVQVRPPRLICVWAGVHTEAATAWCNQNLGVSVHTAAATAWCN